MQVRGKLYHFVVLAKIYVATLQKGRIKKGTAQQKIKTEHDLLPAIIKKYVPQCVIIAIVANQIEYHKSLCRSHFHVSNKISM